jgi:membrane-associated phospholipid phosphatase
MIISNTRASRREAGGEAHLVRGGVQCGLWPVDRLMLSYLLAISLMIAGFTQKIEHAGLLLLAHGAAGLLIVAYAFLPRLPGALFFRHVYPLAYVLACYRVMSLLIRSIRETRSDAMLAAWDFAVWKANPTVWLERVQSPVLTEVMQIVYALFVPFVLAVAAILWVQQREEFRSYAFLLTLGFLASYLIYFIVPARGPRFFLDGLQTRPLTGLWLFAPLRSWLDVLESPHYDCFPSGHAEMTILAWWTARRISKRLSAIYLAYTGLILLATVYLRYHYTVDLVAGVLLAALVLYAAPHLQPEQVRRERQFQDEPTPDFARSK